MNLEMMKQLLQEFSEREALTTEEVKAVQQQSQQLEMRIEKCRARLRLISEDKQKIAEIRQRYIGGGQIREAGRTSVPPTAPLASARVETARPSEEEVERQKQTSSNLPTVSPTLQLSPQSSALTSTPSPTSGIDRLAPSTATPSASDTSAATAADSNRQFAQFFEDAASDPATPSPEQGNVAGLFEHTTDNVPTDDQSLTVPPSQQLTAKPNVTQPPPQQEQADAEEAAREEAPDETVKSINDALRGLFR